MSCVALSAPDVQHRTLHCSTVTPSTPSLNSAGDRPGWVITIQGSPQAATQSIVRSLFNDNPFVSCGQAQSLRNSFACRVPFSLRRVGDHHPPGPGSEGGDDHVVRTANGSERPTTLLFAPPSIMSGEKYSILYHGLFCTIVLRARACVHAPLTSRQHVPPGNDEQR